MGRKIMIVGPSGSGKTTLCNAINGYEGKLRKTQDMIFGKYTIDVPGSYLEIPWMYKHLISAAQNNASQIVTLVDQTSDRDFYAPGFAKVFTVPVTGVVTKCDSNKENEHRCVEELKRIGCREPWFFVSNKDKASIERLKEHLFSLTLNGGEHEIYH